MAEPDELLLLGEGREAEVFAWEPGRALRLMRDPAAREQVEREGAAMAAARESGAPAPAVYGRVEVRGRPGLVVERIDGPDLLTVIGRRPWTIGSAGRTLGEVHARLHEVTAPPSIPPIEDVIRERLRTADAAPPDLVTFALARLEKLPPGDRLLHGDLHPANILVAAGRPAAIDWVRAGRGDPAADVAWTRLLLRLARPYPSAPAVVRRLHPLGRGLLERGYLRAYRRVREIDVELVDRWEPVLAVARLATDLPGERLALLGLLEGATTP